MRLFDIAYTAASKYPEKVAFRTKRFGVWQEVTYRQYVKTIEQTAVFLYQQGVRPGDRVINLLANSDDWNSLDFAVQLLGAVHVAVFLNYNSADYEKIVSESEAKIVVTANPIIKLLIESLPTVKLNLHQVLSVDELREKRNSLEGYEEVLSSILQTSKDIDESQLASIYYTSGTRDTANGVMVNHQAVSDCLKFLNSAYGLSSSDSALSYLPLAHSYERAHNYLYQLCGMTITYAEHAQSMLGNLQESKPTIFTTVPTVIEAICKNLGNEDLIETGKQFALMTGGNLRIISSAGAALPISVGQFIQDSGIAVMECYGTTETQIICLNRMPEGIRLGTVGAPSPDVAIKIAEDGELLVKSKYIMQGYYKNAHLTHLVLSEDGWYRTGDMGRWVEDKFIQITGRIRDVFKVASGRYVSPENIEKALQLLPGVKQSMIHNSNNQIEAVVVAEQSMVDNKAAFEQLVEEHYNSKVPDSEKIKSVLLMSKPWTIESGELTPTMKPKRAVIIANINKIINDH
jgi:long-chain acyl-CoA synthetase